MGLSNYVPSSRISQAGVCTSTTRPAGPYEGQVIYETDTNRVLVYDASAWVMIADTDQPPGLQLVKSQAVGSGVSSVTVSDVFSSEYDNYFITWNNGVSSVTTNINIQLSGATTANQYYSAVSYFDFSTGTTAVVSRYGTVAYIDYMALSTTTYCNMSVSVLSPNLPKLTTFHAQSIDPSGNILGRTAMGIHGASTAYTGFVMSPTSGGTLTGGNVRVYGYRI